MNRRGRSCSKTGWKKVRWCDELVEGEREAQRDTEQPTQRKRKKSKTHTQRI